MEFDQETRTVFARYLATLPRTPKPRVCAVCGREFMSERATRLYCSQTCNSRAYERRKRERERARASEEKTKAAE